MNIVEVEHLRNWTCGQFQIAQKIVNMKQMLVWVTYSVPTDKINLFQTIQRYLWNMRRRYRGTCQNTQQTPNHLAENFVQSNNLIVVLG